MQIFMAVPMTPSAAVADFGSRRYRRFILFNFVLSLAAPHLHGVLVLVTGNKFISGVVVTSENCSRVSLSPAINLTPVTTTPAITENAWQGLIAGVVDTGDKTFIRDYLREFSKKFKTAPMVYLGAWGTLIHEKKT
jgi:hypothetical protein